MAEINKNTITITFDTEQLQKFTEEISAGVSQITNQLNELINKPAIDSIAFDSSKISEEIERKIIGKSNTLITSVPKNTTNNIVDEIKKFLTNRYNHIMKRMESDSRFKEEAFIILATLHKINELETLYNKSNK